VSRDAKWASAVFVLTFVAFNANGRVIGAGDTYPARFIPFGILQHGTVYLDPIRDLTAMHHAMPYWIQPARSGRSASLYPVVLPVVATPLYLPAVAYLNWTDASDRRVELVAELMEKVTASFLAALASALMYLLLRRRLDPSPALLMTMTFAFATTTWSISAQAMWQHGLGEVCIAAILLLLTGEASWSKATAVGALAAAAVGNRPQDALMLAALGIYAVGWAGRRWAALAAGGLPVLGLTLSYNFAAFGNAGGGYGRLGQLWFSSNVIEGFAGLLLSPAKGLLVFSPFFLFLAALPRALRDSGRWRALDVLIVIGFAAELLVYACSVWTGGWSWGYRLLTDFVPGLIWVLAPVVAALQGKWRFLFLSTVALSIFIQYVGTFHYSGVSQPALFALEGPSSNLWSWRHCPILVEYRQPIQPPSLSRVLHELAR